MSVPCGKKRCAETYQFTPVPAMTSPANPASPLIATRRETLGHPVSGVRVMGIVGVCNGVEGTVGGVCNVGGVAIVVVVADGVVTPSGGVMTRGRDSARLACSRARAKACILLKR